MDVFAEYRRRAAECERLAEEAITEEHRQAILKIAQTWHSLADQRERMAVKPKSNPQAGWLRAMRISASHDGSAMQMIEIVGQEVALLDPYSAALLGLTTLEKAILSDRVYLSGVAVVRRHGSALISAGSAATIQDAGSRRARI
jgi:hypothetical protein